MVTWPTWPVICTAVDGRCCSQIPGQVVAVLALTVALLMAVAGALALTVVLLMAVAGALALACGLLPTRPATLAATLARIVGCCARSSVLLAQTSVLVLMAGGWLVLHEAALACLPSLVLLAQASVLVVMDEAHMLLALMAGVHMLLVLMAGVP